ncbi:hypothetical protein NECAME_10589 [Necator americanus]|uniref:Uncharacterized protein n=1 Tax=Necator americanus TaxID=51031 RepID=W2TA79_NECAM|nr:hypothetical protein NECAME_10589 [Necator americanus]ETN78111.1 hypothetical protein NECAME_10589 [Necator americanus]
MKPTRNCLLSKKPQETDRVVPKKLKPLDGEALAFAKLRYKDIAKYILAGVVVHEHLPKRAPPSPDPRTVINEAVVEDDRSPYPPYAMNRVGYLMLIRYPTLFIII